MGNLSVIRNVTDMAPADRLAMEHVLGQSLAENQQLIISVVNVQLQPQVLNGSSPLPLPDWCNVFAGLSDEEIADIEKVALTRANLSRTFE